MTIDELRWFLTLAETEHVTEAAARLRIAQPTLSRALLRLEQRLGTRLFDRDRHRLRLNDHGRIFRRHAQRALDELDAAQDRIAAMLAPPREALGLAFVHSLGGWLVPRLLGAYAQDSPGARFTLHQGSAATVLELLRDGTVEAALTSPRPSDPQVGWLPLRDERLGLAVPAEHRLADRALVRLDELADERLIIMRPSLGLRQITCELFHRAGMTPDVVSECAEVSTIHGLVASGLGVAVVPAGDGGPPPAGVRLVPIADHDAYRTIGLVWHRGRPGSTASRRFREFAARYARDTEPV
ncbi:LysR family transcriptional regulator [Streptantibioticus rubrisoli]|uniref:LysR family transcriptional regulator n=1 Tax=Streptantibioticus rubrisoli TaxID=1387313 RepID=A0ABT1PIK3_9ACTN|nr:LysR family transcriptional regulator [Streptantibioticus rubrisoli]MCQ4045179.1 LysR family transcriptional regulator [Streptantibioticus rubrisoli]